MKKGNRLGVCDHELCAGSEDVNSRSALTAIRERVRHLYVCQCLIQIYRWGNSRGGDVGLGPHCMRSRIEAAREKSGARASVTSHLKWQWLCSWKGGCCIRCAVLEESPSVIRSDLVDKLVQKPFEGERSLVSYPVSSAGFSTETEPRVSYGKQLSKRMEYTPLNFLKGIMDSSKFSFSFAMSLSLHSLYQHDWTRSCTGTNRLKGSDYKLGI